MHKNNIPLKVALGYSAIAIIMILAISLVYSNTKSINAINEASREYIQKRGAADSTISALLKEEQRNLKKLSDAMTGKPTQNYLQDKVKNLNTGKDSILVHSKAPQTHEAKKTTVEVLKTRRGFFRRLADAFKKEHAETLSVKQDSNRAVIDSVTTPVNVAENVATILDQIDKKEKVATQDHKQSISKELEELKAKIAASKVDSLFDNAEEADGVKIASAYFTGTTGDTLRGMCDSIRDKAVNPVVAVLVGKAEDKITMAVTVNKLAQEKGLKAGVLVKELSAIAGGKGGGKPDFAMAGLKDETKIDEALAAVSAIVKKALG